MARSNDTREREKIVREIEKTNESIRKKYRALKTGKIEDDIAVRRHLELILEPLQKIADDSGTRAMKRKPNDDATPAVKREEDKDAIWNKTEEQTKKKRLNVSPHRSLTNSLNMTRYIRDVASPPTTSTPRTTIVQPMIENLPTENVFETTDDSFEVPVQREMQTPEGQEALRDLHWGPLSQKYIGAIQRGDTKSGIDNVYGVVLDNDGMRLGSKRFDVDDKDNILIEGMRYIGTPGLYELIFKKEPDSKVYSDKDMQTYKHLLLTTNAHRRGHNARGALNGNRGYKYKNVIAPMFKSIEPKESSGGGLPRTMMLNDNAIDYVHWDDPNELVDRLRLLDASRQAGHNGHDNEMLSIIEELREAGIIIN